MHVGDQPPIGILLCTGKNQALVAYALADLINKLLVSKWKGKLPAEEKTVAFWQQAMRELAP